jgi:hypothetical protein
MLGIEGIAGIIGIAGIAGIIGIIGIIGIMSASSKSVSAGLVQRCRTRPIAVAVCQAIVQMSND